MLRWSGFLPRLLPRRATVAHRGNATSIRAPTRKHASRAGLHRGGKSQPPRTGGTGGRIYVDSPVRPGKAVRLMRGDNHRRGRGTFLEYLQNCIGGTGIEEGRGFV